MGFRKDASTWDPNRPFQPEPEPPQPAHDPDWVRDTPLWQPPPAEPPDRWIEEDLPGDPGTLPC